ncbi:hypothetical protein NGRA_3144 [Nosema granulosis]|uniref:Uncharacterized protein n=1 Tax=Nosema granulosis TaxID=83296 RepID=A0A9P6KX15_9MICR|nr:hypothetical protein NGRA_3144 [Nosema granulosis]
MREVKRNIYEVDMEMTKPECKKLEIYKRASEDLKNFIVDEISREEGYENILIKLEQNVKENDAIRMIHMTELLYEKFESKRKAEIEELRKTIKCFNCGRIGVVSILVEKEVKARIKTITGIKRFGLIIYI